MSFCKSSSQLKISNFTQVENVFISQYMPNANATCVKVYMYGLYLCNNGTELDNTITNFSRVLDIPEDDILLAFQYWQENGLVQIIDIHPIEVRYLPVKAGFYKVKKYNDDKYSAFNASAQALLEARMLTPTEFTEYYSFLEYSKMDPNALLMIIKYCVNIKGANVGYPYILTVAKAWSGEGIKSAEAVEQKLQDEQKNSKAIAEVLKALGSKRKASYEEYDLFKKWTNELGFDMPAILSVAKSSKKSGFTGLNNMLIKLFELKLFTPEDIENYNQTKQSLNTLARNITKKIGLYYENLESVVETYLAEWQLKGYAEDVLMEVAAYCFKRGIRTLEGMNDVISKLYKKGITTLSSLTDFTMQAKQQDTLIKQVLSDLAIDRNVTQFDRDMFRVWIENWNISAELLKYASTLANGKLGAMQYLNKVLSNYHTNKIVTVEQAKAQNFTPATISTGNRAVIQTKKFTDEEINSMFDNLDGSDF